MSWNQMKSFIAKGLLVEGDKTVPPTKWWNHLYLLWYGWKKVAVIGPEVVPPEGWRIGFRDFSGKQMLREEVIRDPKVRLRIGHEGCTFFAINKHGEEIPLQLYQVQNKHDASDAPLL